jgi:ubiquinone/menaquinone biosynthesis C-methylase UbiE
MNIFFEIHQDLPREGPGDDESTAKAFELLIDLPPTPRILDAGCGPGMQTLQLAKISRGQIMAMDTHLPFLKTLAQQVREIGLAHQIYPLRMSMDMPGFPSDCFDLIWSEGAIYNIGFESGLKLWRPWLKRGGYLAVTELSWFKPNPPLEIKSYWDRDYPGMQSQEANCESVRRQGYCEAGSFRLSEASWWTHYYTPLEARIARLREKYKHDPSVTPQLDEAQLEIDLFRKYADWYGYVFYIMQNV